MSPISHWGQTDIVPNNCGLANWYLFWHEGNEGIGGFNPSLAGCGWNLASFRNKPAERKVYEWIKSKYPIVFQSPVRVNKRTKREWFFVIFDTKKESA